MRPLKKNVRKVQRQYSQLPVWGQFVITDRGSRRRMNGDNSSYDRISLLRLTNLGRDDVRYKGSLSVTIYKRKILNIIYSLLPCTSWF